MVKKYFKTLVAALLLGSMIFTATASLLPAAKAADVLPTASEIVSTMKLVDDYWIANNPSPGNQAWNRAVYFMGNMAMYYTSQDQKYLNYALTWANNNNWQLYTGSTKTADNQAAGQTYIDLYNIQPDPNKVQAIKSSVDTLVNSSLVDNWSWIDAIFMAAPVFSRLGKMYNDTRYYDKMYALYNDTKSRRQLYDTVENLWYRDASFLWPNFKSPNGYKCFWSRGDGWVIASLPRILQTLPVNDPHKSEYEADLKVMAARLKTIQGTDGFWRVSLYDYNEYPGPETSGTALFTYAIAWGINNGLLDSATYYPVVAKAWNGMVRDAVHSNGKLGYVQGVGSQPSSSQPVTYETTSDFGVGAFLLAGSEVSKLGSTQTPGPSTTPTPTPVPTSTPTPAGDNLALNKPVTYSSQQAGNEAYKSVDGDSATRWSADTYPEWINVDLSSVYTIGRTEIIPYSDRAYQYRIEVSTDGTNYVNVVDKTSNTIGGSLLTDTFNPVSARYVRFTITGCYDYTGTWASINEFGVYKSNSATPTPTPPPSSNLALNKSVAASYQIPGHEGSKAVDGDMATTWAADYYPQSINVDLGRVYAINKTEIALIDSKTYRYKIEVSTDGINYTPVVDKTSNSTGSSLFTDNFSPVNTRYVKLTITSGPRKTSPSVNEFRVFGP